MEKKNKKTAKKTTTKKISNKKTNPKTKKISKTPKKTKTNNKKIVNKKTTKLNENIIKKEKKNDKIFWIIIFTLIIMSLILFYFLKFGRINNNKIPTGNVDIFDIDINVDCECEEDEKPSNKPSTKPKPSIPSFNETTDKEVLDKIFVSDESGDYIYQQNLNIFNNPAFEYTNKIAPGVGNTYDFVVHNSMNENVNYYLKIYEETKYNINIKYRLRKNDEYIIGNKEEWVTASELQTEYIKINKLESDKYSLDWKWFDDDKQDTFVGKNMNEKYKLNIRFYFEIIEEK